MHATLIRMPSVCLRSLVVSQRSLSQLEFNEFLRLSKSVKEISEQKIWQIRAPILNMIKLSVACLPQSLLHFSRHELQKSLVLEITVNMLWHTALSLLFRSHRRFRKWHPPLIMTFPLLVKMSVLDCVVLAACTRVTQPVQVLLPHLARKSLLTTMITKTMRMMITMPMKLRLGGLICKSFFHLLAKSSRLMKLRKMKMLLTVQQLELVSKLRPVKALLLLRRISRARYLKIAFNSVVMNCITLL
mmetsp:Transcript_17697/g.28510  ORF Transcript_17697/g.28510 Transcript_17697/m.28510 type:complete len:245 (+) Transcript_17697:2391-3125(+)